MSQQPAPGALGGPSGGSSGGPLSGHARGLIGGPAGRLVRGLFRDLVRDALVRRPLPPLARLPLPARVRRALPEAVGEALRRTPHAAVFALVGLLLLFQQRSDVAQADKLAGGALAVGALLPALYRPVLAGWLLVAGVWLSAFHPGGLDGPFPFADVRAWPELLFYDSQGRPWATAGLLAFAAVLVLLALRLRLRAAVCLWVLVVAIAAAANGPLGVGTWAMALLSAPMPVGCLTVTGLREARAEAAAHAAATEEERARRLLLEERAVIARELHDVVAHHMSVVAIQAEAAPYRVEQPPPELAKSFAAIRENAVAALAELRRVLGVVRVEPPSGLAPTGVSQSVWGDAVAGSASASGIVARTASGGTAAPQPALADLEALLAGVRAAGAVVRKTVTGELRELPRGVELSAYRIVQEALSNALRHAPKAAVRVELAYGADGLALRVVNEPSAHAPAPSTGAGHGLTGMRERVVMLGGRLHAGPTEEGGFEVTGFLPSPAATGAGTATAPGAGGTRDGLHRDATDG